MPVGEAKVEVQVFHNAKKESSEWCVATKEKESLRRLRIYRSFIKFTPVIRRGFWKELMILRSLPEDQGPDRVLSTMEFWGKDLVSSNLRGD